MVDIHRILSSEKESGHIEVKTATEGVPQSMWETYSAFANTDGGVILLGVQEDVQTKKLIPIGIKNTEKMKFILPETGGTGRGILYIAGVFLLGISMILLGNKNSSFYECLHKKG